jgi:HK97 family phage prohead protease
MNVSAMMARMKTLLTPFMEFKLDSAETGVFRGYGSTFGNVDLGKDKCVKGCFKRSLGEHAKAGTMPFMYWMHDRNEPIGDWTEVDEDDKGLRVVGKLWTGSQETECSRKAMGILKGTAAKGLSIGYRTQKHSFDQKTGVRSLEDVDLPEVSVVGYGMNPKALVSSIKSLLEDGAVPTIRDIEELLRDAGFSATQAKAFCSEGYKGIARDADVQKSMAQEIKELMALRDALRGGDGACG